MVQKLCFSVCCVVALVSLIGHNQMVSGFSFGNLGNLGDALKKIPGMENVNIPQMPGQQQSGNVYPQQQQEEVAPAEGDNSEQPAEQETYFDAQENSQQLTGYETEAPQEEATTEGGFNFADMAKSMICKSDADCAQNQYLKTCHKFVCSFM